MKNVSSTRALNKCNCKTGRKHKRIMRVVTLKTIRGLIDTRDRSVKSGV